MMRESGEDLQSFCDKLLERIGGLEAILVTDTYGVPLISASRTEEREKTGSALAATFSVATEQAGKLKMGKNTTLLSFYSDLLVFQLNLAPLVITMLGEENTNAGLLLGLVPELKTVFQPLRKSVSQVDREMS
ncbi:Ragulator complex protein lamtor3 [Balamuthia mandrillaris]